MTHYPKPNLENSAAKSLFIGNIIEENLFPYPAPAVEERETLRLVLDSIDSFLSDKEELFRKFDREGSMSEDFLTELKELGLFGVIIPEEFGGIGLSSAAYARVVEQICRYDASISLTVGAHSSIGMRGLLLYGTPEQKKRYLPRLASGELISGFCLTEPGAGSDAASIRTSATLQSDGSWLLSGEKIWITNGPFAGLFTVFARTESVEGKITAFIVERSWPGVSVGSKEDKMGIRASATCSVAFENVRVPAECVLGEVGQGFKVAMSILNNGRTGLGGGCLGAMKSAIARAALHAQERKQFGKPIADFKLIREKIAQMVVQCFAAESVIGMVASYVDRGFKDFSVEAAAAKVVSTEALWFCANESMQIAGGTGFMKEYPYEAVVRDSRINMIFEGTNEILRLYIALSGLKDAAAYLSEIKKSAAKIFNDPIKGFGVLSGYMAKKLSQLTSVGEDRLAYINPGLRRESAVFESYTARLGRAAEEVLRRCGKHVVDEQLLSKRLAEIAIDLFTGLSVLSRVSTMMEARGANECQPELAIARLFTQQAKRRMNQNLRRLFRNEDQEIEKLAAFSLDRQGYRWDPWG